MGIAVQLFPGQPRQLSRTPAGLHHGTNAVVKVLCHFRPRTLLQESFLRFDGPDKATLDVRFYEPLLLDLPTHLHRFPRILAGQRLDQAIRIGKLHQDGVFALTSRKLNPPKRCQHVLQASLRSL
uniref:(northern house mosquito) hypothetical protein n=1 Tax=Culex pipiens TaxID=7175 RepID=A0A8D8BXW1_CULPI